MIDTNTWVSRLLLPGGVAARAVDEALARGTPLVSEATLLELATVLARPKFDRWVSIDDRQRFVAWIGTLTRSVVVTRQVAACRDPHDDKFLDVALNGDAEAIVTGDRDLLALDPFHHVRIVTPAEFLQRL